MAGANPALAARVAQLALRTFDLLPKKCKPRIWEDGRREWTPLSAVILKLPEADDYSAESVPEDVGERAPAASLKIVSLATGTKCLPASAITKCDGSVLHDCHAEILAFRGLNLWLLQECKRMLVDDTFVSKVLEETCVGTSSPPFKIKRGVEIFLFSTEAPCGDASMELLMSSNSSNSSEAWSQDSLAIDLQSGIPLGRGHFSHLGVMRRKPARGDAEPSLSMSCTDKITLKQVLGVLSFPVDLLVETTQECFVKALVVYENQYSEEGHRRAFGRNGRLNKVVDAEVRFFEIHTLRKKDVDLRFVFEKPRDSAASPKASNISALWISGVVEGLGTIEVLVGGVKQGYRQFEDRPGKQSSVSRRQLCKYNCELLELIKVKRNGSAKDDVQESQRPYQAWKTVNTRKARNHMKEQTKALLGGWRSNSDQDNPFL